MSAVHGRTGESSVLRNAQAGDRSVDGSQQGEPPGLARLTPLQAVHCAVAVASERRDATRDEVRHPSCTADARGVRELGHTAIRFRNSADAAVCIVVVVDGDAAERIGTAHQVACRRRVGVGGGVVDVVRGPFRSASGQTGCTCTARFVRCL